MKSWLVTSWFLLLNLESWIEFLMLGLEVLNPSWINFLGFWHHQNCLVRHHEACFYRGGIFPKKWRTCEKTSKAIEKAKWGEIKEPDLKHCNLHWWARISFYLKQQTSGSNVLGETWCTFHSTGPVRKWL